MHTVRGGKQKHKERGYFKTEICVSVYKGPWFVMENRVPCTQLANKSMLLLLEGKIDLVRAEEILIVSGRGSPFI